MGPTPSMETRPSIPCRKHLSNVYFLPGRERFPEVQSSISYYYCSVVVASSAWLLLSWSMFPPLGLDFFKRACRKPAEGRTLSPNQTQENVRTIYKYTYESILIRSNSKRILDTTEGGPISFQDSDDETYVPLKGKTSTHVFSSCPQTLISNYWSRMFVHQ